MLELNFKYILFMALFQKLSYMCCQRQNETALMIGGGDGVMQKKKLGVCVDAQPSSRRVSDHYLPLPQRVCPAPANILILYIIFALSICGVLKSHLNERSQFTFDFAITRTLCKVSTSYNACIIIRHVDILIIFFSKHILPIPNHIYLNNYYYNFIFNHL